MTLPSRAKLFRIRLVPLLLVVLGVAPYVWTLALSTDPFGRRGPSAEEATPESRIEISAAPAEERARHLAGLGVPPWHQAGVRGQGIRVAILDSGFRGYRKYLGRALPETIAVRSFRADHDLEARDSQHGILCGEVIHALAPDAQLLMANWEPDHASSFLDAVRWAKAEGANVISCSLIMPSWSDGEGGGDVHAVLSRLVGSGREPDDLLFFACAGNTAQRHWTGTFRPDGRGFHEWLPGEISNRLRPWGHDRVAVELYGPVGRDYELQVYEGNEHILGRASIRPGFSERASHAGTQPGGCAVVRFLPRPDKSYSIRLRRLGRPTARSTDKFHLVALGGSLARATATGSIPFPADGARVQAVGAVDSEGRRLFYSSCGPNSRRPKPDFVAPVPFASLWRDRAFAGTSAAAPQAAGLAALWWSRHPDWTAEQVRQAMREAARDLGPPGHDWETGYGLVHLP